MATAKANRRSADGRVTPKQAAARLRAAGIKVRKATKKGELPKPLDVPGLNLTKALKELRGKSSR